MGISHLKPPSHEAPSMRSAFGRLSLSRTTPSVPKAPAFWFTNITQSEETAKTDRIRRVARNCKASDIHRAGTTAAPLRRTGITRHRHDAGMAQRTPTPGMRRGPWDSPHGPPISGVTDSRRGVTDSWRGVTDSRRHSDIATAPSAGRACQISHRYSPLPLMPMPGSAAPVSVMHPERGVVYAA